MDQKSAKDLKAIIKIASHYGQVKTDTADCRRVQ